MGTDKITVLLVEPHKYPRMVEIEDTLESMQELVGGPIEEYMPFEDDVAIVCNEEGKIRGSVLNRAIYSEQGEIQDVICGKFFVCYAPIESESFLSLPEELAKRYEEKFKKPERFFKDHEGITVIPYTPKSVDMER